MNSRCFSALSLVAVSLWPAGALLGEATETKKAEGIIVSLATEFSEGNSITDPMTFHVGVENTSQNRFTVERISVTSPTAMRRVRGTAGELADPVEISPYDGAGELSLLAETRNDYTVHLDAASPGWADSVTLLFLPGEYTLSYAVTFKNTKGEAFTIPDQETIELTPPFHSVLRGGVLGALLLTIFLGVYRLQHWLRDGEFSGNVVRSGILSGAKLILQFVVGAIVASIVILLLNRSTDLPVPITIEVKDYMGGLLVGLFSYQLGDIIYQKLFGRIPGQTIAAAGDSERLPTHSKEER